MENLILIIATIVGAFLVYIYFREKREEQIALEEEKERTEHIFRNEGKETVLLQKVMNGINGRGTSSVLDDKDKMKIIDALAATTKANQRWAKGKRKK